MQGSSNQLISGVPVTFQASSGAIAAIQTTAGSAAQVPAGTTDVNGTAQATLSTPANYLNRTITVTATAGSASNTIQVQVVGTQISVSGPGNLVQGATGNYSITLLDSGSNPISGQTVTLASALGNTVAPASGGGSATNSTGVATFTMTATNSGSDTLTGSWQTLTNSEPVSISNQNFSITAPVTTNPLTTVDIGTAQPVTISWSQGGTPQNGTVQFTTSRGTLSAQSVAVTNGSLASAVNITSTTAGEAIIAATALNSSNQVVATTQTSIEFVATNPAAVSVQASPSTVPIKGQSTITATVTDPTGNPVANATVNFTLTDTTGGQLSSAFAQTNFNGLATVTYTASTSASATNGVVVAATVANTSVTNSVALTVGGQTVFLSLGTGNTVIDLPNNTQYELPYSVQAVDSAGNGVTGVTVQFKVLATGYVTGQLGWNSKLWVYATNATTPVGTVSGVCSPTTVLEYNGVINPSPVPTGVTPVETDIPGSVASTDNSSVQTTTGGTASVNVIYPKDHANWVQVVLQATATVSGTQSTASATFILPGATDDYNSQTTAPPGEFSPYGMTGTCW